VYVADRGNYSASVFLQDDVVLSSKYGQMFRCTYSAALQAEKSKWNLQHDSSENQLSVTELLKPLELSTCLVHVCKCQVFVSPTFGN
jgi:hypothetical protein